MGGLHDDPSLVRAAFEEALRYHSPAPYHARVTTTDVEFEGVALSAGERIVMFVGAANRNPRHWSRPDEFDVHRRAVGHLAFGLGIHNCVGQVIARMEAEALLGALARRVRRLEIAGPVTPRRSSWLRGPDAVPVRLA